MNLLKCFQKSFSYVSDVQPTDRGVTSEAETSLNVINQWIITDTRLHHVSIKTVSQYAFYFILLLCPFLEFTTISDIKMSRFLCGMYKVKKLTGSV